MPGEAGCAIRQALWCPSPTASSRGFHLGADRLRMRAAGVKRQPLGGAMGLGIAA